MTKKTFKPGDEVEWSSSQGEISRHRQEKADGARRDQGTSRRGVSEQSRISGAERENRRANSPQARRAQAEELTPATDGCGENQRPQRRAAKPNATATRAKYKRQG